MTDVPAAMVPSASQVKIRVDVVDRLPGTIVAVASAIAVDVAANPEGGHLARSFKTGSRIDREGNGRVGLWRVFLKIEVETPLGIGDEGARLIGARS